MNGAIAAASTGGQPGRGAGVEQSKPVAIGVWIDGSMPQRGETIRGYVQGIHLLWLQDVGPASTRRAPTTRRGSAPTGYARHGRAALPLQPRRQEPGGDGAGGDPAAAAVDPGHAGDPLGGPREGPRVDHQLLRHADDPPGVPAGQAALLRGPGISQLPAARGAGGDPLQRAHEGGFSGPPPPARCSTSAAPPGSGYSSRP